jgi:hypothetical protein
LDVVHDGGTFSNVSFTYVSANDNYTANIPNLGMGDYNNLKVTVMGCPGADGTSVTLSDPNGPTAMISTADVCEGTQVSLDASGSTNGGSAITSYAWVIDVNNDGADALDQTTTGVNPMVALPVGTHKVVLTVTQADGCQDMEMTTVTVHPAVSVDLIGGTTVCADAIAPITLSLTTNTNGTFDDGSAGGSFGPLMPAYNASITSYTVQYTPAVTASGTITLTFMSDDPTGPCGP